jgi:predicted nucleic acid-binding protein
VPIVELDLLIAFVNASDRHHKTAQPIFYEIMEGNLPGVMVASSAYLEYELVHGSFGYLPEDTRKEISGFMNFPNLREAPLTSEVIVEAMHLREDMDITYFDSLHAATALLNDRKIISTDTVYDEVGGLRRVEPEGL